MVAMAGEFPFVGFDVDKTKFESFLKLAFSRTSNLKLALIDIGRDFYKDTKKIFLLKGAGKYDDLSPRYKARKEKILGSAYPILRGFTRNLEDSITSNTAQGSVYMVGPKTLVIGTNVKSKQGFLYPAALQFGTRNMPARPFLFIDKSREKRWNRIIANYLATVYGQEGWTRAL